MIQHSMTFNKIKFLLLFLIAFPACSFAARSRLRADTTPPSVSISSPLNGTVYSSAQTIDFSASATDKSGVQQVEFYDNNTLISVDTTSPYNSALSITSAKNGTHTLTAKATDLLGNSKSVSVSITVNIGVADTAAPSTPLGLTAQSISSSQINLQWLASSDNVGVTGYQILRCQGAGCSPSTLVATSSTTSYANSGLLASTTYVYAIRARDAAGNLSIATLPVSATTMTPPDTTAPTVAITSPANGASYATVQTITVAASASDNIAVARVDIFDNNVLLCSDTVTPYSCSLIISSANNGAHSLVAKAYDAVGNSASSNPISITVNIPISTTDTQPPVISILNAVSNKTYYSAQSIGITASAQDNVGINKVEFYKNGQLICSTIPTAYNCVWNITNYDNGLNTWQAKAYDTAGNITYSNSVNLTVKIPVPLWANSIGGVGADGSTFSQVMKTDSMGDIFMISGVSGIINYDKLTSVNGYGASLSKYSKNGDLLWTRLWSRPCATCSEIGINGILVNSDGSVVVAGYIYGTINFDGSDLTSVGGYDSFLIKYSSTGERLWVKRYGTSGTEVIKAIAVDLNGNLYATGYIYGTSNLGGNYNLISNNNSKDIFIAKYTSNGDNLWAKSFGGSTQYDEAKGIAIDSKGNPWITGSFSESIDFGNGPMVCTTLYNTFIAGFSTIDGKLILARQEGKESRNLGYDLAIDKNDNIYLVAAFYDTATFGNQTFTSIAYTDIALVKYSSSGSPLWSRSFGGENIDVASKIDVNSAGEIVMGGETWSGINLGGGYLLGNGSINPIIAKYNTNGEHVWSLSTGKLWDDKFTDVAIDDVGEVVALGTYADEVDFGNLVLSNENPNYKNVFLVRFAK